MDFWVERGETWDCDVEGEEGGDAEGCVCGVEPGVGFGWELRGVSEFEIGCEKIGEGLTIVMMRTLGASGVARSSMEFEDASRRWNKDAVQTPTPARTRTKLESFMVMV